MSTIIGEVKVAPEVLTTQAAEVRRLANSMKQRFQSLEETVNRTGYYWIGEGGDSNRKLYQDRKDEVDNMLRRLLEHPSDLEAMAGNYRENEQAIMEMAQTLDENVIS